MKMKRSVRLQKKALEKKTGARGLRSILENVMLDAMFETPSNETIKKVIITKESIEELEEPKIIKEDVEDMPQVTA